MEYKILDKINSPQELKNLPAEQMPELCSEIRRFLVENVMRTGGHLASNLGCVEMSLAMHRVFDTPKDHFIFDVGHQSYVHKIVTGRRDAFDTLRSPGGLSGFTKRSESEHDCFGAGHSSTSLSAALGFAKSDMLTGNDAYTVAVVGDGAFTGGMIHEAINNCSEKLKLIIIINENEMSISRNTGGFASHMSKIRSSKGYFKVKDATSEAIKKIPLVGNAAFRFIRDTKQTLKDVIYSSNYFETMGLYYMGPVDGNDYDAVERVLCKAKNLGRSTVVHLVTKKGKGYKPAENSPSVYHGVAPKGTKTPSSTFSSALGDILADEVQQHGNICAITAAMPNGTGLDRFAKRCPENFFDVGIAEEHAATFAAGLAANGMKPYFAVYSSFLQRAYDSVLHDIALQGLPVTLCVDRAGLSEGDGATHHGIFDVSFLSGIPDMEIYCPVTFEGLRTAVRCAYEKGKPCAIRYSSGGEDDEIKRVFYSQEPVAQPGIRCDFTKEQRCDCVMITYGKITSQAIAAKKLFAKRGVSAGIILLEKLKPYGELADKIAALLPDECKNVIFIEEGIRNGGASVILFDELTRKGSLCEKTVSIHAIDDVFSFGEKGKSHLQSCFLTAEDIIKKYFEKN